MQVPRGRSSDRTGGGSLLSPQAVSLGLIPFENGPALGHRAVPLAGRVWLEDIDTHEHIESHVRRNRTGLPISYIRSAVNSGVSAALVDAEGLDD
jgi:hypothetical protein